MFRYLDDIPTLKEELYAGVVLSKRAHANISVDATLALDMEGVVDFVCIDDVPGSNLVGKLFVMYRSHTGLYFSFQVNMYV